VYSNLLFNTVALHCNNHPCLVESHKGSLVNHIPGNVLEKIKMKMYCWTISTMDCFYCLSKGILSQLGRH